MLYIHILIHTYMHTMIYTRVYTYAHTVVDMCLFIHIYYTQIHTSENKHTYTHAKAHTHM